MQNQQVLVIEDDEDIQELLRHHLLKEGLRVSICSTGEEGIALLARDNHSANTGCILLDRMLPGIDGMEVCRLLKKNPVTQHIPVVMVTAKGAESDIVAGLELGADDYIVKPFSPRVLIARVRLILRRKTRQPYNESAVIANHAIEIYPGKHVVLLHQKPLDLTHMEFSVLHLLASQPGWVFTRNQIMDSVRADNYPVTERSVDVVIVGLRRKLGDAGDLIETVRGVGYRCVEKE